MKRKILFCIPSLTGGGAEKALVDVLSYIDYEIFDVDILLFRKEGVYLSELRPEVKVMSLFSNNRLIRLLNPFDYILRHTHFNSFLLRIFILKKIKKSYDIEVAFLEGLPTKIIGLHISNAIKIAWIHCDLYNFHWSAHFFKSDDEERRIYNQFDKLIFVSNSALNQFSKLFAGFSDRSSVIYNILNTELILCKSKMQAVHKRKLTLCAVGRLTEQKGFNRLINVCKDLCDHGFDFDCWILGDGHLYNELNDLVASNSLSDVVFLKGYVSNPYPYIASCDFLVSPSLSEGFSLVIAESLLLGIPVVATNTSGPCELLDDCGVIVENSENGLRDGITFLFDKKQRDKYAKLALNRSKIFKTSDVLNQINKIFGL